MSRVDIPGDAGMILSNSRIVAINKGESGAGVYNLFNESNDKSYILKLAKSTNVRDELIYENKILHQLKGLDNIPKVLYFLCDENMALMLRSKVEGYRIDHMIDNPVSMVKTCGRQLRRIHELTVDDKNLRTIEDKLEMAKYRVDKGHVDENNFEDEFLGMSSSELYQQLLRDRPGRDNIVFTHGDFTFENILFSENKRIGVIDWGGAMMSDRYQDIGLFIRSLRHKYGLQQAEELTKAFCKSYGLNSLDSSKVEFYILLDEFF